MKVCHNYYLVQLSTRWSGKPLYIDVKFVDVGNWDVEVGRPKLDSFINLLLCFYACTLIIIGDGANIIFLFHHHTPSNRSPLTPLRVWTLPHYPLFLFFSLSPHTSPVPPAPPLSLSKQTFPLFPCPRPQHPTTHSNSPFIPLLFSVSLLPSLER